MYVAFALLLLAFSCFAKTYLIKSVLLDSSVTILSLNINFTNYVKVKPQKSK